MAIILGWLVGTDRRKLRRGLTRSSLSLGFLLTIQIFCALYFISSVLSSLVGFSTVPISWELTEQLELAVSAGMILSIGLVAWALVQTLRERNHAEDGLRRASAAFGDLLEEKFAEWRLTAAERDVALLAIKGLSMAEIAGMRDTSEGTVRAQSNAIYRKAGVTGRQQLLSLFIDEMLGQDSRVAAPTVRSAPAAGPAAPVSHAAVAASGRGTQSASAQD